jgi:hypothetical protein
MLQADPTMRLLPNDPWQSARPEKIYTGSFVGSGKKLRENRRTRRLRGLACTASEIAAAT